MTSWAASSQRVLLNDSNRGRFSVNAPSFENFPSLVLGPGVYEWTRWKPRSPRGQVALHKTSDGISEREREIYGTPVKKILPISASTYNPKPSLAEESLRRATRMSSTFVSNSGRKLWDEPPDNPSPLDYSPTPAFVSPRAPSTLMLSEERPCTAGVVQDPLPGVTPNSAYSMRQISPLPILNSSFKSSNHSPGTGTGGREQQVSPVALNPDGSSPRSPPILSTVPGIRIPKAKRHLNIHNLNSGVDRSRDADFDNPPPGTYESKSPERHRDFSVMRGTLNGVGRN